jgi:hypothetical protein
MDIAVAGPMPKTGSPETDGTLVYKVLNAQAFSAQNQDRVICRDGPIQWLTIQAGSLAIRMGWLTVADYHDYRPNTYGLCLAQSYDLSE